MPAKRPIPKTDHVMRFVPYNRQKRHPVTDAYEGLSGAAFALRKEDKGGLSLTWVEYFGGNSAASRVRAACAHRESLESKKLGAKAIFAWASVSSVIDAAKAEPFAKKVRVVHAPVEGNAGHVEARRFTDEDLTLLDLMATDIFQEVEVVGAMNLPDRQDS